MRYTRYNYRQGKNKKPHDNFLVLSLICIVIAVGIGLILVKLLYKDSDLNTNNDKATIVQDDKQNKDNKNLDQKTNSQVKDDNTKKEGKENIYMIQCGVYSKEESAKKILGSISNNINKFISKEDDKFRVVAGIYNDENSKNKSEELKKANIDNVRIKSQFDLSNKSDAQMYSILKGFIDILNKLENNDIKSINTEDFKKWTNNLEKEENKDIKELKSHIEKLPQELDKEGAKSSLNYIYNLLKKYRV